MVLTTIGTKKRHKKYAENFKSKNNNQPKENVDKKKTASANLKILTHRKKSGRGQMTSIKNVKGDSSVKMMTGDPTKMLNP